MRASISVLGPLLARCGEAEVALPGGDAIGSAALDMHVAGLERLGADGRAASTATSSPTAPPGLRGAHDLARLPERRRHREPADGRGAGQGHDGHRQRRPRARDRRPLPDAASRWAPRSTASARSTLEIDGVDGLHPVDARRRSPTGSSPAPGRSPPSLTRGDVTVRGARGRAPRDRAGQAGRAPAPTSSALDDGFRVRVRRPAHAPSTS